MPVFNFLLPWSRSSLFLSSSIHAALPQLPPDSISPLVGLTLVLTCSLLSYCHLPPSLPPLFPTTYLTLILISSSFSPSLPLRWTLVGPQRSSSLQCRVSEGCSFLPLQEAPLVISSPLPASHSQPDVLLDIHIDILHTQELPVLMCWYGTSSSIISPGATFGYFAMGWCWWEFLSLGMVTFRKLNFAPKRDFFLIFFILTWKVTKSYCEASGCICPHYISSFKDRHEYGVIWLWVKHLQKLIISSFPKWGPRPPGGSQ